MKKLPIGIDDFAMLREHDFYYVDKTGMIRELLHNWGSVNLFARPRRFGKSLNMSMLRYFFEIGSDPHLFDGLTISKDTALCEQYQGQFPVMSLTLKQVSGQDCAEARSHLWAAVSFEAGRFSFLRSSDKLDDVDREIYRQLQTRCGEVSESLLQLSRLLFKHYGKKVIILIDEYDVPLQKAEQNGYYQKMAELMSQLFGYGMKSNPYMEFAVVTGCFRIAKESIFTGFNNTKVHSIVDEQYDEWFGFTDAEVREMLAFYSRSKYYELTKKWYDGYLFGKTHVYCPWDVISWCDQLVNSSDYFPRNFWANTSGNDIIRRFADRADEHTRDQLGYLIEGGSVRKHLNLELTYNELDKNIENLWSVLLMTGYLTQNGRDEAGYYELRIPNREITNLFIMIADNWFTEKVLGDEEGLKEFFSAIDHGDAAAIEECLNIYMEEAVSFLDSGKTNEKESFYHGLLLGMLNRRPGWITKSNREAGNGRLDVVTYPKRGKNAAVFEFKYTSDVNKLDEMAQKVLMQIRTRHYDSYFSPRKLQKIEHYGIAFHKKQCRVMKG